MDRTAQAFLTFGNVAQCSGGRVAAGEPGGQFHDISVDSRKCTGSSLYIPIYGERVDGHLYIESALRSGAVGALMSRKYWTENGARLAGEFPGRALVVVDDPLKALQETAGLFRERHLSDVVRVGVTGSSGKTTMKELLGGILKRYRPTSMNPGNLNSDIGLPMAVLSLNPSDAFSVLEMGMNREGEMDILADIYRPEVAVVTNIGRAHIGLLGSVENIAREKRKIFRYLGSSGAAFIWEGEKMLPFLTEGLTAPVYRYGEDSTPDFQEAQDQGLRGWLLNIGGRICRMPLMGRHNLRNALGAVSAARYLGASLENVCEGLEAAAPLFGRGQIQEGAVTLLLDCYNANPDSYRTGLSLLAGLEWPGRKILVAGDMGELGEEGPEAHREVGRQAAGMSLEGRFFFGQGMKAARDEAAAAGAEPVFWHDDFDALLGAISGFARRGDLLYIKGSRMMELERLAEPLGRLDV